MLGIRQMFIANPAEQMHLQDWACQAAPPSTTIPATLDVVPATLHFPQTPLGPSSHKWTGKRSILEYYDSLQSEDTVHQVWSYAVEGMQVLLLMVMSTADDVQNDEQCW